MRSMARTQARMIDWPTWKQNIDGRLSEMKSVLLDTWAVMAIIRAEQPAATKVRNLLADAAVDGTPIYMSIINVGEVYYISRATERTKEAAQHEVENLRELLTEVVPADEAAVLSAAHYKLHYKLSYADAFAVAAAVERGATLLTGDPEILALESIVQVEPLVRAAKSRKKDTSNDDNA